MYSINNSGYVIEKDSITDKELNKLKSDLHVKPIVHPDFKTEHDNEGFSVFRETDKQIIMPRYYGINKLGLPDNNKINLTENKVNFNFSGKLREYQIDIVNKCLDIIKKTGGGLLSLSCGQGKTVIAIYLAWLLGVKTLVIVHKTFLMDQWIERISQFTNAKIGIIRQDTIDIKNKDIVIGMLQSISMKEYDSNIFSDFSLVICDEVHHFASRVFSNAMWKTSFKYTVGLSATLERQDGLTKVINWFLGDIMFASERKPNPKVIVNTFHYKSTNRLFVDKKRLFRGKVISDTQKMITNICEIEDRNNFIVNIINTIIEQPERKVLILSGRVSHLETLKKKFDDIITEKINKNLMEQDECKSFFYMGKCKEYERKEAENEADVLFATFEMAHEGLDIDRLNTILMVSPKGSIVQAIGRIMRKETEINPLIIDIADELSSFSSQYKKRLSVYKKNKYNMTDYYVIDDIISTKDLKPTLEDELNLTNEEKIKIGIDIDEDDKKDNFTTLKDIFKEDI